jgi:hypothetical protein
MCLPLICLLGSSIALTEFGAAPSSGGYRGHEIRALPGRMGTSVQSPSHWEDWALPISRSSMRHSDSYRGIWKKQERSGLGQGFSYSSHRLQSRCSRGLDNECLDRAHVQGRRLRQQARCLGDEVEVAENEGRHRRRPRLGRDKLLG